jgi:hypothetical protein
MIISLFEHIEENIVKIPEAMTLMEKHQQKKKDRKQ